MKSLENHLTNTFGAALTDLYVWDANGGVIIELGSLNQNNSFQEKIYFGDRQVGSISLSANFASKEELVARLAPFLHFPVENKKIWFSRLSKMQLWIEGIQKKFPGLAHWIGVYLKEDSLMGVKSNDLVLGPFLGDITDHIRISIDRGICGMAVREERAVNVADVSKVSEHIACSLRTKSELVIPLRDHEEKIVAELDLDSEQLNAFTKNIEEELIGLARGFSTEVWT